MLLICDFSYVLLFPSHHETGTSLTVLYESDPQKTADTFSQLFYFNDELLQEISQYVALSAISKAAIFTAGRTVYAPIATEKMHAIFSDIFTPEMLGFRKNDPRAYVELASRLHCRTNEIVYIDDSQKNTTAAIEAGCIAHTFIDTKTAINFLHQQLLPPTT